VSSLTSADRHVRRFRICNDCYKDVTSVTYIRLGYALA